MLWELFWWAHLFIFLTKGWIFCFAVFYFVGMFLLGFGFIQKYFVPVSSNRKWLNLKDMWIHCVFFHWPVCAFCLGRRLILSCCVPTFLPLYGNQRWSWAVWSQWKHFILTDRILIVLLLLLFFEIQQQYICWRTTMFIVFFFFFCLHSKPQDKRLFLPPVK